MTIDILTNAYNQILYYVYGYNPGLDPEDIHLPFWGMVKLHQANTGRHTIGHAQASDGL